MATKLLHPISNKDLKNQSNNLSGTELVSFEANASAAVQHMLRLLGPLDSDSITICVGPGNNGYQGLLLAQHLAQHAKQIKILQVLKNPLAHFQDRLKIIDSLYENITIINHFQKSDIVIDAIFGNTSPKLTENLNDLIKEINNTSSTVIAIDIPSGADATNEESLCILADHTFVMCNLHKVHQEFFKACGDTLCIGK